MGWRVAVAAATFIGLALIVPASADVVLAVDSRGHSELVATDDPGRYGMPAASPTAVSKAGGVQFNVYFEEVVYNTGSGFDDAALGAARRTAVNDVLDYIGSVLNEDGECDIAFLIPDEPEGAMPLAYGGTLFNVMPGPFSNGYAFEHITTGVDPDPRGGFIDLFVAVYFDWPWYVGTGAPGVGQLDFRTVLLHELTHGLGILSLTDPLGASVFSPKLLFSRWDAWLETLSYFDVWDSSGVFVGSPTYFYGAGGGLYFAGPLATAAYGSRPRIYTPVTWREGSSMSHWSIDGSVMYPALSYGVSLREYIDFELAALGDLGYGLFSPGTFAFVKQPAGGLFTVGDPLELEVAVTGTSGEVGYQWRKDTNELPGEIESTFLIASLELEDSGDYWCIVTDDFGPRASNIAQVSVFSPGELPAAGVVGLGILAAVCLVAGAFIIFKRS